MENKVIKLGVVGLKRGAYVAWTIIGDKNVVIRAVADKDPETLKACKEDYERNGVKDFLCFDNIEDLLKSDIDAVTEPILDAVVFQMSDLLGQGDYGKALLKLQQLFKMQQEPIMILGTIGSHFRRLGTARLLLDNGKNAEDLMCLTGLKDYPARKTMSAAGKFPARFYAKATELILESDRQMKTSFDDSERILEILILRLAQEVSHG